MPTKIVLFGQGGHAKVVVDTLLDCEHEVIRIFDDNPKENNTLVFGDLTVELAPSTIEAGSVWHVAIGSNVDRLRVIERYLNENSTLITLIHTSASVSGFANIGHGTFVAPLATIGIDSKIGQGCIINHGSVIDHDCYLSDGVHIAPNATLGGGVQVGKASLIGAGAIILPGKKIGDNVTIGAGSVVTVDVPDGQKVIGVPGRVQKC